jgi:hypothetical protein
MSEDNSRYKRFWDKCLKYDIKFNFKSIKQKGQSSRCYWWTEYDRPSSVQLFHRKQFIWITNETFKHLEFYKKMRSEVDYIDMVGKYLYDYYRWDDDFRNGIDLIFKEVDRKRLSEIASVSDKKSRSIVSL